MSSQGFRPRSPLFPLSGGRRLLRPTGEWAEILATDGVHEAYLDLTVRTAGPDPGLADRAREEFDYVVKVKADYPREESERPSRDARTLVELYGDYYLDAEGVDAPEDLISAFVELAEEVRWG